MSKHHLLVVLALVASSACESAPPEPAPAREPPPAAVTTVSAAPERPRPPPPKERAPSDDPLGGKFTLEDATKGLTGSGALIADIDTDQGKLECTLYDDKAPVTVANFVGLARGVRPFKTKSAGWVTKPGYDSTTFHRIIKGFMIQGGDPEGTGGGEPGYVIPDELWPGAKHDRRGLICMANRGPNTNGMQFFITDAAAPHLDRSYTIFGSCGPDAVIEKLASVEVRGERPAKPPAIKKVTIRRGGDKAKPAKAPKAPAASPSASP